MCEYNSHFAEFLHSVPHKNPNLNEGKSETLPASKINTVTSSLKHCEYLSRGCSQNSEWGSLINVPERKGNSA